MLLEELIAISRTSQNGLCPRLWQRTIGEFSPNFPSALDRMKQLFLLRLEIFILFCATIQCLNHFIWMTFGIRGAGGSGLSLTGE
jgi:hypothetical protein